MVAVDDGSTDGSWEKLTAWTARDPRVTVFRHERIRGKGAAIRTALAELRTPLILIQDADLEYDPADYPKLLAPIRNGAADVVYGSRLLGEGGSSSRVASKPRGQGGSSSSKKRSIGVLENWSEDAPVGPVPTTPPLQDSSAPAVSRTSEEPGTAGGPRGSTLETAVPLSGIGRTLGWHRFGNRLLTWASNRLTGLRLTDEATCYKLFNREVLARLELTENGFGFCPEVTAKVAKLVRQGKVRLIEVPITYRGRTRAEGKKIRLRDGLAALACLWRHSR